MQLFNTATDNKLKFLMCLGIIVALILVFYLGYVYGNRESRESKLIPKITTILSNGNRENSLSQIRIRDIYASNNSKDKQVVGRFYYIVKDDGGDAVYTDILFKLDNSPLKVSNPDNKSETDIPLDLNVDLAYRSLDGQGFDYTNIGQTKLSNDNKSLKLDISAVLDFAIDQKQSKSLERIVFRPLNPDQKNIYVDKNNNLPLKVRGDTGLGISGEPAPYFWVEI